VRVGEEGSGRFLHNDMSRNSRAYVSSY
jgi:hypothetical protein